MRNIRLENLTVLAVASFAGPPDDRQRQLVQQLVTQLRRFTKDVQLTHAEWRGARCLLHRVGEMSSDARSEFSLLSDVTGLRAWSICWRRAPPPGPAAFSDPFTRPVRHGCPTRPI